MIDSWKKLIYALSQMREMQKTPGIEKKTDLFFRLKKVEAEVDECIDRKITEWNGQKELDIY
jgi:hypothetical protein